VHASETEKGRAMIKVETKDQIFYGVRLERYEGDWARAR
jgi:hypothetical protein